MKAITISTIALLFVLAGCSEEQASNAADESADVLEQTSESIGDVVDEMDGESPAEDLVEEIEGAMNDAASDMEDMAEAAADDMDNLAEEAEDKAAKLKAEAEAAFK